MRRPTGRVGEQTLPFPMLVTFGALTAALLLFLTNTAPALREQQLLEQAERDQLHLRQLYVRRLAELRTREDSRVRDLQSLLVAIDSLGLTPGELLALHPEDNYPEDNRPEEAQGATRWTGNN